MDFNDLEHYTLAILAKNQADGWQASEASVYYREKFDEVLVDEYQDINQLQESILYWLRRRSAEGNFMVGDVKQSIYSFRLQILHCLLKIQSVWAKRVNESF